jgi:hypothetical protein
LPRLFVGKVAWYRLKPMPRNREFYRSPHATLV